MTTATPIPAPPSARRPRWPLVAGAVAAVALALALWRFVAAPADPPAEPPAPAYKPRRVFDTSGFGTVNVMAPRWSPRASLADVADVWRGLDRRLAGELDARIADPNMPPADVLQAMLAKASLLHYGGDADQAYTLLTSARGFAEQAPDLAAEWLYTLVYFQGVTALRRGENDNCVMCRGESSCIIPIAPAARHLHPTGSKLAVKHFTEYLDRFPDDLEVRWLLNVAHMTLGEHPAGVAPKYLVPLDRFNDPEHGIGKFRDVGHLLGVNRFNQAGGAILDDFDGDGLLDIVFTTMDALRPMAFYRNKGDGAFEDRTAAAGLTEQLGGLNCVQADYNNDGRPDIFVIRGAWLQSPIRPSLLRNNGNGTFTDVTAEAGLAEPVNAIAAQWADYDNDGRLDLFVCSERGMNRLYRNKGDGTFEEVAERAGLTAPGATFKGCAWLDYDGDRLPDLFLTDLSGAARLYRNMGDGTFEDRTALAGISGPQQGFSCWAWDYDNDGWPDIFATCYDRPVAAVVKGLTGQPHDRQTGRLYRNLEGKGFRDVTKEAGVDGVFVTMGSNFGDLDNDGFLDFYLGTGDPQLSTLVPNRMFRNLGGRRFAEITGSSGTGHLQKGHGVSFGDWDRNGSLDVLIQMGGAIDGDRYHNVMFQNPGQGQNWLSVKLIGTKSNASAIGARIKATTGARSQTVCRFVSSGSSFGANPLEQHIGLGKADKVATLEVYWPTSDTTQVFRDVPANTWLEITEGAAEFRTREFKPVPLPK